MLPDSFLCSLITLKISCFAPLIYDLREISAAVTFQRHFLQNSSIHNKRNGLDPFPRPGWPFLFVFPLLTGLSETQFHSISHFSSLISRYNEYSWMTAVLVWSLVLEGHLLSVTRVTSHEKVIFSLTITYKVQLLREYSHRHGVWSCIILQLLVLCLLKIPPCHWFHYLTTFYFPAKCHFLVCKQDKFRILQLDHNILGSHTTQVNSA